jgi:hypothetical protein
LPEPRFQPVRLRRGQDHDVVLTHGVARFDRHAERLGALFLRLARDACRRRLERVARNLAGDAGIGIEILRQPRRTVGVDALENLGVADMDLSLLQHDRHRDDQREVGELALKIVTHADDCAVAVAHQDDL